MNDCRASADELAHDHKQMRLEKAAIYSANEQRMEVCALAKLYMAGQAEIKDEWGNQYPIRELMVTVWDHQLYEASFIAQANGVSQPMTDLITRCARYACAVHLFGESRADELGFVR